MNVLYRLRYAALLLLVLSFVVTESRSQDPPAGGGQEQRGAGGGFGGAQREPEIRPYDRVITKDAKSDAGIFTVHRIKEKIYYEIPAAQLNKEFLWVSQIAKTTLGVGYGGQAMGNRVVRWERQNNRVLMRSVSYEVVADPKEPINRAVRAANNDAIIMSFFIEALGKDDAPVIDVTRLFTTEVTELSARGHELALAYCTDSGEAIADSALQQLQRFDVVMQTLSALADFMQSMARETDGESTLPLARMAAAVTLGDLRRRLSGADEPIRSETYVTVEDEAGWHSV